MSNIYEKQNEPELFKYIAAQHKIYNKAKKIEFYKYIFNAVYAAFAVIASWSGSDLMTAITLLLAGAIAFSGKYIDMNISKYKDIAALTQQYADVTLYNYLLEYKMALWGRLPTKLQLAETLSMVENEDLDKVKNWYSDYSGLPPIEQVFCCQKENIRWDTRLRQEFKCFLIGIVGFALIGMLIPAFIINPSLIKFLCTVSFMMPLSDFGYVYWNNLKKDIIRLESLHSQCNNIDKTISRKNICNSHDISLKEQKVIENLIDLQNAIMRHRTEAILIPNWFYRIRQKQHQKKEDIIAREMTELRGSVETRNKRV